MNEAEARLPLQSPDTAGRFLFAEIRKFVNLLPPVDGSKDEAANRFLTIAMQVLTQKPDLLRKCSRESVLNCLIECARLRLDPEGALGHAYLIPYGRNCTVQVSYKGFCQLAWRVESILKAWCKPVFQGDEFKEIGGAHPDLIHVPLDRDEDLESSMDALTHVYACVKLKGGEIDWEVMNKLTVLKIKGQSTAWEEWPIEMAKIRPLKRLMKRQRTTEITLADGIALDDREGKPRDPKKELGVEVIEVETREEESPLGTEPTAVTIVSTRGPDAPMRVPEDREEINSGIENAWGIFHNLKLDTKILDMDAEYADYLNPDLKSDAEAWKFRDTLIRASLGAGSP